MAAKILVVDDEPDLELLIKQKFRKKIHSKELVFDFAKNGKDALEKLEKDPSFDLVLTDINMPVMDGLSLLVRIKEKNKFFKAVVVSAYGDMRNIRTAMNAGAYDFVTKPIDFHDLESTINKTIEEVDIIKQGLDAQRDLLLTKAEKELADIERQKAEQSKKFKEQFLANMSHEIRTPLNAVVGMTNLVMQTDLNEQQRKYIDVIKQASGNLLSVINDILDLSKIEAGKIELEQTPFSLKHTITSVYNILKHKSDEKGLAFHIIIDDNVPGYLIGDPVRLSQVLINLSGNAVKFTEKGSVTIRCQLIKKTGNSVKVKFSVEDTGIGIPDDKQASVFESFTQASSDTTRKFGGTGLGLSISKHLVELHNSEIQLTSKAGEGTTFFFTVNYEIADIKPDKKSDSSGKIDHVELAKLKILLVEDNEFNQMVAEDTLQTIAPGIKLDIADNGRIAVDKVAANDYDLILMDVQMPEMDGYEATKTIRLKSDGKQDIHIIAMTANVTKEEVENCFKSGMNDYLPKPFEQDQLAQKLSDYLLKKSEKLLIK